MTVSTIATALAHTVCKPEHTSRADCSVIIIIMIILLCRASTVANFIGKMGVASDNIGNCTIYSQRAITIRERFLVNQKKLTNSQTFSFADYSRYTVYDWYNLYIVIQTAVTLYVLHVTVQPCDFLQLYHGTSMISQLIHEYEVKPSTSVNKYDIIRVHVVHV